ncbi:nucleotidyl transferase AbiEii/AbiGii toxin family protein [Acidobacteriota bacterium]
MKERLKQIIAEIPEKLQAKSLVREFLQSRILQFLQESGAFRSWIFHGGTALRFLYRIPRYSEDLDFALKKGSDSPDFSAVIKIICKQFETEAYQVEIKTKEVRAVKSAFIHFPDLLFELGLSSHQTEKISIKIDLDSNPPDGGVFETTVIRHYVTLHLFHYDKASFLSGKLHAILNRAYTKGRDLFDIFWYLSDPNWPSPNIVFLNNALNQTDWSGPEINKNNWHQIIEKKVATLDWDRAINDVHPFIERTSDLNMLTRENIQKLLRSRKDI